MTIKNIPAAWITVCQTGEIKAQKSGAVYQVKVSDQVLSWTDTYEQRLVERLAAAIQLCTELMNACEDDCDLEFVRKIRKEISDLDGPL